MSCGERGRAFIERSPVWRSLATMLLMDYVFSEPWRLRDCLTVLSGLRVILVAVRCDLAELERRERQRGDREQGIARAQIDVVHAHGDFDIEVWSDRMDPTRCAAVIAAELPLVGAVTAFDRLRQSSAVGGEVNQ